MLPRGVPDVHRGPANLHVPRPAAGCWQQPEDAVREFLSRNHDFEVDEDIEAKLLFTVAPGGYLRRR